MRIVSAVICLLMLLFALAQYNDPDTLLWVAIYGLPALLAGVGAWRPQVIYGPSGRRVLMAALMLAVAGMVYYWPVAPEFWRVDVWWDDEPAREGLGMMIVTICLLIMAVPLLWRPE